MDAKCVVCGAETTDAKLLATLLEILRAQYQEGDIGDYVGSVDILKRIIKERDGFARMKDDVANRVPL